MAPSRSRGSRRADLVDRWFYKGHSNETPRVKKLGPVYEQAEDGSYVRRRGKLVEVSPGRGRRWYVDFVSPWTGVSWSRAFEDFDQAKAYQLRLNSPGWRFDEQAELSAATAATVPTFREAAEAYMARKIEAGAWKPLSIGQHRRSLDLRVLPAIGDLRLDQITPDVVSAMIRSWPVSGTTAGGSYDICASVFRDAVRRGLVGTSPMPMVARPKKDSPARSRVLTPDEIKMIIDAAPERHRMLFQVAAGSGLRRQELAGLQVRDLVATPGAPSMLVVRHQLADYTSRRGPELAPTKSDNGQREVPLPLTLARELREWLGERDPDEFMFTDELGRPFSPQAMTRLWSATAKASGVRLPPRTGWHILRHAFVSRAVAAGVPIPTVARAAGHDSVTLQRAYAHDTGTLLSQMAAASDQVAPPMYQAPEVVEDESGDGDSDAF